ncbi:MAG: hypothetical protein OXE78_05335 [Gammaproteobacteria bacterium]|nr:hypothetical protein [Gammaproteobacteria bacterium]MCY4358297.1 hypothetical protein [Gammaproteobacteria bacterium]
MGLSPWGQKDIGATLFIGITISGILLIIITKQLGLSQIQVTAGPVLLILLYAVAVFLFRKLQLRDEIVGDNCYYMGLVYTLVSLAYSLYEFSNNTEIDLIVTNFGIAIFSTIVGLVLRVFFSQMRVDIGETEAKARDELAEAARALRTELESSKVEFSDFRRVMQQSLDEAFNEMRKQLSESLKKSQKDFEQGVSGISGSIIQAKADFEQRSGQFKDATAAITEYLDTLNSRLRAFEIDDRLIRELVDPLRSALRDSSDRIDRVTRENLHTAAAATSAVRELENFNRTFHDSLTLSTNQLGNVSETLAKSIDRVRTLDESHASTARQLAEAMSALTQATNAITESTAKIGKLSVKAEEALRTARGSRWFWTKVKPQ